MDAVVSLLNQAVKEASQLRHRSAGELAMELLSRLESGVQVRITRTGVRVTHSRYLDRLASASEVDDALASS